MLKFIGWAVPAWLGLATAIWTAPVSMAHTGGAVPLRETSDRACAFDEPGMENCPDTASYLWRLPTGERSATTTWEPSRADVETVTGRLILEHADCPDSRVGWTVVAGGHTGGTLTGDNPTVTLDLPVGRPLHEITLTVRRLDTASCGSALRWADPRLEPPFKLLP